MCLVHINHTRGLWWCACNCTSRLEFCLFRRQHTLIWLVGGHGNWKTCIYCILLWILGIMSVWYLEDKMWVREKSLNKCVYSCSSVSEWKEVCATVVEIVVGIQSLQILCLGKLLPFYWVCPSLSQEQIHVGRIFTLESCPFPGRSIYVAEKSFRVSATQVTFTMTKGKTEQKKGLGAIFSHLGGAFSNRCCKEKERASTAFHGRTGAAGSEVVGVSFWWWKCNCGVGFQLNLFSSP